MSLNRYSRELSRRDFGAESALQPGGDLEPIAERGDEVGDLAAAFTFMVFIDEDRLCLCVGDVSGKGVPSALFMAVTRTLIQSTAKEHLSPAKIFTLVNDELSRENESCMFVTIFLAILDVRSGEVTMTNAGHNPPYLKHAHGDIERLDERHGPIRV